MGDTGFEHNAKSPEKPIDAGQGGAESGAVARSPQSLASDLKEVIVGWEQLSTTLRAVVLAIVRTSRNWEKDVQTPNS